MNIIDRIFAVLLITFLILGCDRSNLGVRSGTLTDDYVEEPLSFAVQKYKSALDTSNKIIEKFIEKDYDFIHSNYVDESFQNDFTAENMKVFSEKLTDT